MSQAPCAGILLEPTDLASVEFITIDSFGNATQVLLLTAPFGIEEIPDLVNECHMVSKTARGNCL